MPVPVDLSETLPGAERDRVRERLSPLLTPRLGAFLAEAPAVGAFRSPDELDKVLDGWQSRGVPLRSLGTSKNGRAIRAAVFGTGARTLLAWGYPHPDEPLGAEALVWLGEGMLDRRLPDLDDWQVVIVLCADPDEAGRQLWLEGSLEATAYARGAWRPTQVDWMVDYGFPLDWGPFWQPEGYDGACRTTRECLARCGPGGCEFAGRPHSPLPESVALSRAIDFFVPDVVAAMHSTHTGGDYTFLLEREPAAVLADLTAIPAAAGTVRHLGEAVDRGRRWRRDAPDLIREPSLEDFRRAVERIPGYDPELAYQRNHSAACYLQAQGRGAQFICPESTLFSHPAFADERVVEGAVRARVSVEDRRRGRYRVVRIPVDGDWVVAEQTRAAAAPLSGPQEHDVVLTRGMLGVAALTRRRKALAAADALWGSLDLPRMAYHPYVEERARMTAPGAYVNDRSMLIFRTRPDYRRPATVAQEASFRWLWPAHTASLMANFQNYLRFQQSAGVDVADPLAALSALQDEQLACLPAQVRAGADLSAAMRSMLARVLRVMLART